MIVKIVTLFLVFMAVLAMFGKLKLRLPRPGKKLALECPSCGRYRIGRGPCSCGDG